MRITKIAAAKRFELEFDSIATDKSISHRGAMFALLANAPCEIKGFLEGEDTLHTLEIAKNLGLVVEKRGDILHLTPPKGGLQEPKQVLDCGNAGTGMRLYVGLLSGVKGHFVLSGDEYLNARPMGRVIEPLSAIGADIRGREQNKYAPLSIQGARLKSFNYQSKIASAQVKSAMILAGLRTEGKCRFYEPLLSRNHTENMLKGMGVKIQGREIQSGTNAVDGYEVEFEGSCKKLESFKLEVPADPSSAFFFAVAACVLESKVLLKNVLLNKTRIEAFKILESMGHSIVEKSMLDTRYHISAYYIICTAEASSNLARFDGVRYGTRAKAENLKEVYLNTRSEYFGDEVKRRILLGSFVLSSGYYDAYYLKAQKVREKICADYEAILNECDSILLPIAPTLPPKFGTSHSPLEMYLSDIYTIGVNLAGLPAICIPTMKNAEGLSVGMQFIGGKFEEQTILNIAYGLEKELQN